MSKKAKNKFSFTTAEGKVETRSSDRTYTHVVVMRTNVAALRVEAVSAENRKQDRKNFAFFAAMASGEVGKIPAVPGGWNWPLKQEDKDKYAAQVAPYRDAEDYADKRAAARLEHINKQYGAADIGPEYVAQWSMSETNARKGVKSSQWIASARVVALACPAPAADNLSGWVPEDDPDAWKARDDSLIAAAAAKRKA